MRSEGPERGFCCRVGGHSRDGEGFMHDVAVDVRH